MLKIFSNFMDAEGLLAALPEDLKNKPITIFNDYYNVTPDQLKINPYTLV